jgi:hypothetical protein
VGSPTKKAMFCAVKKSRGHLDALMCFYSIKLLFIAWSIVNQGFVEPSAPFNSRMMTDNVVLLPFQRLYEQRRSHDFQGWHSIAFHQFEK